MLTVHIVASVGLLGDVAAMLAVNVKAATTGDPALAASSYELLTLATGLSVFKPRMRRRSAP